MKDTRISKSDLQGKFVSYDDKINYSDIEKHHKESKQDTLQSLLGPHDLDVSIIPIIEDYVDDQVRLGVLEFINRFLAKMSQNLHGFCLLRALGYDVTLEHNGKSVNSLRQLSDHFQVSHQYIDKLTKDYEKQIGLGKPKEYNPKVKPPDGYITIGQAMKKYKLKRNDMTNFFNATNCTAISYKRNSKIIPEGQLTSYLSKIN